MVATEVRKYVDNLNEGSLFRYEDLKKISDNKMAIAKILSRLTKEKKIDRIEKGLFYKPKVTRFGKLNPNIEKIIKAELKKENRVIGYISGDFIYNKLGLTTQIPKVIEVMTEKRKPTKIIEGVKIKYTQKFMKFTKKNIEYFQILDALKNIKKIPDSKIEENYEILKEVIKELENKNNY